MNFSPSVRALLLPAALLSGCAFAPGQSFATVTGSFEAHYEAHDEEALADGWAALSDGFEVRLSRAALTLEGLLLQARGAQAQAAFDPAHPPEGYSNCHGGHCHGADGALVPYEEIAGGTASSLEVVEFPLEPADLLAEQSQPLACDGAPCELDAADIHRMELHVERALFEGEVRDGRTPARFEGTRTFSFDTEGGEELAVGGSVELPVDRRSPPGVKLTVLLHLHPALFEGLDWDNLAAEQARLRERLEASELTATVERSNERPEVTP